MASSTLRIDGLWLPAISNLNCGRYEKVLAHEPSRHLVTASDRLDLGLIPAPTLFGFNHYTNLAPRNPARSVGCRSVRVSMNVSIGAFAA